MTDRPLLSSRLLIILLIIFTVLSALFAFDAFLAHSGLFNDEELSVGEPVTPVPNKIINNVRPVVVKPVEDDKQSLVQVHNVAGLSMPKHLIWILSGVALLSLLAIAISIVCVCVACSRGNSRDLAEEEAAAASDVVDERDEQKTKSGKDDDKPESKLPFIIIIGTVALVVVTVVLVQLAKQYSVPEHIDFHAVNQKHQQKAEDKNNNNNNNNNNTGVLFDFETENGEGEGEGEIEGQ